MHCHDNLEEIIIPEQLEGSSCMGRSKACIFMLSCLQRAHSYKCEDSNHYLFHCPLYTTERGKMLDTVNEICSGNVDLNLLLHGGQTLDYYQNKTIIESVELYILETKRLL